MSGKILNTTPISGEYPEFHFGKQGLWVEFEDNNFQKWYGCFSYEHQTGLNKVLFDNLNKTAFIVSGGNGYLLNITNRTLLYETEKHPLIESIILTENPDYYVAGTFCSIYIFDKEKLIKEIHPDMILDGIYFKSQLENKAFGELATAMNQYDRNIDFELDLETFELKLIK